MIREELTLKMIDYCKGNTDDIEHFLKVQGYAAMIGRREGLDERTQNILELAAIVHDISCPYCREKYGNANGKLQEQESPALLRPFLAEFDLEEEIKERIIYLVSHHHTVSDIDGIDYQILIEADYLVNAAGGRREKEGIRIFRDTVARTETGRRLLDSIYLREEK